MDRSDFLRGYLLLTTQPWGRPYREDGQSQQEPSPAKIQAELYFKAVESSLADAWTQSCARFAAGEHWPSLDALRMSLRHYRSTSPTVPAPAPHSTVAHDHQAADRAMRRMDGLGEEHEYGIGKHVFLCSKLFAGREQVQREYRRLCTDLNVEVEEKTRRLQQLNAKALSITEEIKPYLEQIAPADMRTLLTRYEKK